MAVNYTLKPHYAWYAAIYNVGFIHTSTLLQIHILLSRLSLHCVSYKKQNVLYIYCMLITMICPLYICPKCSQLCYVLK